ITRGREAEDDRDLVGGDVGVFIRCSDGVDALIGSGSGEPEGRQRVEAELVLTRLAGTVIGRLASRYYFSGTGRTGPALAKAGGRVGDLLVVGRTGGKSSGYR